MTNYVKEKLGRRLARVQCSEIREALNAHFGDKISDNELGVIVREAFPGTFRKRSNNVNYYENISIKVQKVDEEIQVEEQRGQITTKQEGTQVDLTGGLYHAEIITVPECMIIDRNQLAPENPEVLLGKGAYGEVSLHIYQGMEVAVKKFRHGTKEDVLREMLTILNVRAHNFLPIVYGVSLELKPFLLISKFYGSAKRSKTLQYCLKRYCSGCQSDMKSTSSINDDQFLQIAGNICEGLRHIHQCGYLHGDIKSNNILIVKQNSNLLPKIIDFGKSCKISSPSYSCIIVANENDYKNARLKYPHMAKELLFGEPRSIQTDAFAYGVLLKEVLTALNKTNTEFDVLLERVLSDSPENRPSLTCIHNIVSS